MTGPKRVFIDSSGWIEFILKNERYHRPVVDYILAEVEKSTKMFTSDYVLDESYTRLLTGQGWGAAKDLNQAVDKLVKAKQLLVLWTDETLYNKAWRYFEKYREHELSFTDATVVTMMSDLKLDVIVTLDKGFGKVGLSTEPKV